MEVHLTLRRVLLKDWKAYVLNRLSGCRRINDPYEFKVRRGAGRRGHRL